MSPGPFRIPEIPDLYRETKRLWQQVPAGHVSTYGQIARALGSVQASRFVGQFARHHDHDRSCRCHRLVRANGELGLFVEDPTSKKRSLQAEGIEVFGSRVCLQRFGWNQLISNRPLEVLANLQVTVADQVCLEGGPESPVIGGVDVSYLGAERNGQPVREATAAYVLVDAMRGELIWHCVVRHRAAFPYIPGFLAFRELPVLERLVTEVRQQGRLAELTLVDGSGILHPRRCGIATMLGVLMKMATVGVTKRSLCGTPVAPVTGPLPVPIVQDDVVRGAALLPTTGSSKPLFVSPGHGMSVASAVEVVRQQCCQRRLPLAIYWADRISRQAAAG